MQFPATVMVVKNRHQKPLHPLSHQHQEVEVRREKGASEAGVRRGKPIDSRAKTSCKVPEVNYLVTIGIFPNVNSTNKDSWRENSGIRARLRTGRLKINPAQNRKKKDGDKKCSSCLRISGHRAAGIFIDFTEEPRSFETKSTSTMHKSCAASSKHPSSLSCSE